MAVKSSNTQGNPYHDEEGKFTSANNVGSAKPEDGSRLFSIRLKPNFDINAARARLQQVNTVSSAPQSGQIGSYREASSIEEAVQIGKSILPGCEVNYSSGCDLTKVNEMNKALNDIAHRFPGFVQGGLLNAYGDGVSLSGEQMMNVIVNSALNVVKNDKHFKKYYDRFFEQSKARFGLSDEDKYSEKVFIHFMGLDRQFNMNDYTKSLDGGDALAYYQVTYRNMFDQRPEGGAGINGAIKFYPHILQKPTQRELNAVADQVISGFHFDYGEHSYTYGTGVHELGHSIFTIAYKKCTPDERAEIDQLIRDGKGKDYKEVSGYGHHTEYEQEAEAVADVMCRGEDATPHNRKMVAWLDKVHARLKQAGEI